ncbi:hypothetical protein ACGF0D_07550 [Kitasatospora sp. NPDC048298]|uniref:hypothetical protein n=1 Tax=Kitasatospora sp. NPDC048298 TaxID=3364049 RepID=UPI003723F7FB
MTEARGGSDMTQLIVLAFLWALRLLLPARGTHRRALVICGPVEPFRLTVPKRVICAPARPISVLDLRETVHSNPGPLVRPHVIAWERMTPAQQEVIRQHNAEETQRKWAAIIAAELARDADDHRRRRAALFAAALDLPDPEHWLDSITTGVPHTLGGAVA